MPSSIIELPCTRNAKTRLPPHSWVGTSSVSLSGKAWYGSPAATTPSKGIDVVSDHAKTSSNASSIGRPPTWSERRRTKSECQIFRCGVRRYFTADYTDNGLPGYETVSQ